MKWVSQAPCTELQPYYAEKVPQRPGSTPPQGVLVFAGLLLCSRYLRS